MVGRSSVEWIGNHGGGTFGPHTVDVGTLHYADRFTPYGPLAGGERGLGMLTLRSTSDSGAYYMPEFGSELRDGLARLERPPRTRRSVTFDLRALLHEADGDWRDLVA